MCASVSLMCNEGGGVLAGPAGRSGSLVCLKVSLFVLISSGLPTATAVCLPPDGEVLVEGLVEEYFFSRKSPNIMGPFYVKVP